jgi:3',5'-nucleoside bisphosphate phosphatase
MPPDTRPCFDLQSHSTCSDGALAPAEVVRLAAAAGIELLALTDHDTVDGVDEALAAGREHGVRVVPAVEISALHDDEEDLHVLGYLVDHHDETLLGRLADWRDDRARRIDRMADALRELGFALDDGPLQARRAEGLPLGRPHLARAAAEHPANAARLRDEGIDGFSALLEAYLVPGAPAYRRRTAPTVEQAIAAIHDAGGVAVWAHPLWDFDALDRALRTIDAMLALGLDGVEVFYATHDRRAATALHGRCTELGLLTTGSADFHGSDHPRFNRFGAFDLHGLEPDLGPIAGV